MISYCPYYSIMQNTYHVYIQYFEYDFCWIQLKSYWPQRTFIIEAFKNSEKGHLKRKEEKHGLGPLTNVRTPRIIAFIQTWIYTYLYICVKWYTYIFTNLIGKLIIFFSKCSIKFLKNCRKDGIYHKTF